MRYRSLLAPLLAVPLTALVACVPQPTSPGDGLSAPTATPGAGPVASPSPSSSPSGTAGPVEPTGPSEPAPSGAPGPSSTPSGTAPGAWSEVVGIGTRFDWKVADGQLAGTAEALRRIGFRHVRVGLGCECGDVSWETYRDQVAAMAVEQDLQLVLQVEGAPRAQIEAQLAGWLAAAPGHVHALEGANETFQRRDWWDPEWDDSLELQRYIKELADARGLKSYTWSQGGPIRPYTEWPNGAPYATHANFHLYPWDCTYEGGYFQRKCLPIWQDPSVDEGGGVDVVREWAQDPDKPLAVTEWGYSYGDEGVGPIRDETVRAKYVVRNAFELVNAGIEHSYYYSLVDEDNRFGLAERDGTLRLPGQALANVFTLLGDAGPGDTARSIGLSTASGTPVVDDRRMETDEVHSSRFTGADGSTWLALWVDSDSQDGETGTEEVTVDLGAPGEVTTYLPLDGVEPVEVLSGQRVTVTVPDHPLLLRIR